MPPARTLATLLATASLAVPTAALAQGDGGAGDQQYQDPFGSSQTQTTPTKQPAKKKKNGLSQTPNLGASGTAGASTGSSGTATAPAQGTSELPRTGGDTVPVALIGLALLLCGIGLRLRMADERA